MTVTYGFYNSIDHDRVYDALQFSNLFNGIIKDGIFMSVGDAFPTTAKGGMSIGIGTGRAWFNNTWTNNDAELLLIADAASVAQNRIDLTVIEVNTSESVRANTIKIVKGTPAVTPVAPTLVHTSEINQYAISQLYIPAGLTTFTAANITNLVGSTATPFITGVMATISIDAIVAQWESEFNNWFNDLVTNLTTDAAGNLQNQINVLESGSALSVKGRPVNSLGDISNIVANADRQVLQRSGTNLIFDLLSHENMSNRTRTIYVPAIFSTTPTVTPSSSGPGHRMPTNVRTSVYSTMVVPMDFLSDGVVIAVIRESVGSAGNMYKFSVVAKHVVLPNPNLLETSATGVEEVYARQTAGQFMARTLTPVAIPTVGKNHLLTLSVNRWGDDVQDTYENDLYALGFIFQYTADS